MLIHHLIKFSHKINRNFDFEWSTTPAIEIFYKQFSKNFKILTELKFY